MTDHPMDLSQPLPPLPPPGGRNRLILVILAVVVVLGLAIVGVLIATNDDPGNGTATDDPSAPPVACGEVISKPVGTAAIHIDDAPISYPDAPPAFGNHRSAAAAFGRPFYAEDRPEVGQLVHSLEHGYTIAWYDETAAQDQDAMDQLKQIAFDYQGNRERFIAVPWLASDGDAFPGGTHIALTRWSSDPKTQGAVSGQRGNWQYCGTVEPETIRDFFRTWPNQASAEPGLY